MYKVETKVLERIKKHLIKLNGILQTPEDKKNFGTPSLRDDTKIVKENQKLVELLEKNYYV